MRITINRFLVKRIFLNRVIGGFINGISYVPLINVTSILHNKGLYYGLLGATGSPLACQNREMSAGRERSALITENAQTWPPGAVCGVPPMRPRARPWLGY